MSSGYNQRDVMLLLRDGTREEHAQIEAHIGVMQPDFSLGDYRALLARLWGFYSPLEARLERTSLGGLGLGGTERHKAPLLARDLHAVGTARGPVCLDLPILKTPAEALGCMYVLEGATLGGAIISRHLVGSLAISPEFGGSFFASYGDAIGQMWRSFGAAVRAYAANHGGHDAMVESARDTFRRYDAWLLAGGVS